MWWGEGGVVEEWDGVVVRVDLPEVAALEQFGDAEEIRRYAVDQPVVRVAVHALAVERAHEQLARLRFACPEEADYNMVGVEEGERRPEAQLGRRQGLFGGRASVRVMARWG